MRKNLSNDSTNTKKADTIPSSMGNGVGSSTAGIHQMMLQSTTGLGGGGAPQNMMVDPSNGGSGGSGAGAGLTPQQQHQQQQQAIQQQINFLQQLSGQSSLISSLGTPNGTGNNNNGGDLNVDQGPSRRARTDAMELQNVAQVSDTVTSHLQLLDKDSIDGNRLRAYYRLSVDELFTLPAVPIDEDFCARHHLAALPKAHQYALCASRFAEVALGAIVHNEVSLAMELCNATVHCLRECVKEPVHSSCVFEVARGYFLLGVFRAFRGDMIRYFKYRRVCMTHLSRLEVRGEGRGCECRLRNGTDLVSLPQKQHRVITEVH
mmetsp:Transcript_24514/g.57106  ORF Transcript_24514/g.57106 Transcript_24514/m.57106 type:complete len:320 (-) Transcript_24514:1434-2393(-)